MLPIVVVVMMISIIGLVRAQSEVTAPVVSAKASASTLAQNMVVYKGLLDTFVAAQTAGYTAPGGGNAVPDASLAFPAWYVKNPLWTNKVISGTVTVYATSVPAAGDISADMVALTLGSINVGVVGNAGTILSPRYGNTLTALPPGLPVGVPVIQSKVR